MHIKCTKITEIQKSKNNYNSTTQRKTLNILLYILSMHIIIY